MLTIESLSALIALCITCYALGYTHGKDFKSPKK